MGVSAGNYFAALPARLSPAFLENLRAGAPGGLRWFHPDDLHITLAFFGREDPRQLPAVIAVLETIPSAELEIGLGALVPLPGPRRFSAISFELTRGRQPLADLIGAWRAPLAAAAGVEPDIRPPYPHLTVARPDRRNPAFRPGEILRWIRATAARDAAGRVFPPCVYGWSNERPRRQFRRIFPPRMKGHRQTAVHRAGKESYHQIGLVRGQFGDVPREAFLTFLRDAGFDGYEECSWLLDLERCGTDAGARALAEEWVADLRKHHLEIFALSVHLQGQALGDEPSAKTLPFVGGPAIEAYREWRRKGNEPPRTDPFFVPPEVGMILHAEAERQMLAAVRFARSLGQIQERSVPLTGFTGSPARCWSHWFAFPPLPAEIGGYPVPDVRQVSLELLVERFGPFLDACREAGITFDLECHPGERAMGDLESARDYLNHLDRAGYSEIAGFNLDCSHLEWQGVSGIDFIREFGERIHSVHLKGVWVASNPTRGGLLGGHRPMGHACNAWNFVTAGSVRDAVATEEVIVELNRIGYDGALNIEWEDNDVERFTGAQAALGNIRRCDLPPSAMRHDGMLRHHQ